MSFSTDEDVLEIVRALNESPGDRERNSTSLRQKTESYLQSVYRSGRDHDTVKDGRDHIL